MKALTLERRVMVWSAAVVAMSLLVCGGGGALFLYGHAVRDLDRHARGVAEHFFQLVREHGGPGFNWEDRHEVEEWLPGEHQDELVELHRGGAVYFRSKKLGATALPADSGPRFVRLPQGRMRMAAVSEPGTSLRVAVPTDRLNDLVRTFAIIFIAGLPVMLAFVFLGGRWIAAQALEPVRHIADGAEGITSAQLDRRMPVPAAKDEIHRLANVLNATLDRLQTSFQQAMRFSADASHELKTPLTVLHSDLEALLDSPTLCDTDRAAVADTLETAKRLNAITKSLLLLARADAGRLQLDLQPTDLAHVIADCLDDARIMAEAWGLTLEADIPETAPVLGEPVRLRQIAGNLLDNAVKYNQPGGKIRVVLAQGYGVWTLDISNTGRGIPPEQAPRIFERFHRGEHHAGISGHGLGLSLCHELARAHGGTLDLIRSDAEWTTFRLTLKQADSAALQPAETVAA
jgi:signal transduction histidine kinase